MSGGGSGRGDGSSASGNSNGDGGDVLSQLAMELSIPKCCKWRNLSVAVWRPELRAAEILRLAKGRGADLQRLGFEHEQRQYLFIEDAVLLAERAQLALVEDSCEWTGLEAAGAGKTMSLRQLWGLMAQNGVDIRCYLAYRHMREQGYIVRRCHPSFRVPRVFDAAVPHTEGAAAFEVFTPRAGFSRARPGPPTFALVVCGLHDPVPELAQLALHAGHHCGKSSGAKQRRTALKVCTVDADGTVLVIDIE